MRAVHNSTARTILEKKGRKTMAPYVQGPPFPRGLYRGDKGFSFGLLAPVAIVASPGGLSRAVGGVVTCTTSVAHKALPGETATIVRSTSVGGTRFDGNYFIQAAAFGSSVLTLVPVDDVILHQAPDTGGGGTVSLIQMEQPAILNAGAAFGLFQLASLQVAPLGFAVDGVFDAAPGVFEVDVQMAESDVPSLYQTVSGGNIAVVDATNFTFHFDANANIGNFVRLFMRARANAVNFAGSIRG